MPKRETKEEQKKAYSSPQLTVYGTLQNLTQHNDSVHGNPDGGTNPRTRLPYRTAPG
jgi:hypothetical protein